MSNITDKLIECVNNFGANWRTPEIDTTMGHGLSRKEQAYETYLHIVEDETPDLEVEEMHFRMLLSEVGRKAYDIYQKCIERQKFSTASRISKAYGQYFPKPEVWHL